MHELPELSMGSRLVFASPSGLQIGLELESPFLVAASDTIRARRYEDHSLGGPLRIQHTSFLRGLLVAAAAWPFMVQGQQAEQGSGQELAITATFIAKETCSAHFVAGYGGDLLDQDLERFSGIGLKSEIDDGQRKVTVRFPGGAILGAASYRPGFGCTISVPDKEDDGIFGSRNLSAIGSGPGSAAESGKVLGTPLGFADDSDVDRARIQAAVDDAFSEPNPALRKGTRAVVVVHDGRIIVERYAEGVTAATRLRGWSMAKSVTAALAGVLIEQGRLGLFDTPSVPEWSHPDDPRRRISLMNLLEMTTGLEFDESYDGTVSDAARMIFAASDAGGFAADKPLIDQVGSTHRYSSGTTNILSRVIRQTMGDDEAYWRFPHESLFEPIGAHSVILEPDPSGTFVGSSFAWATARDWARLGQLFLQNGMWHGERLLVDGWSHYVGTPTPMDPKGRFGAHFATNAGDLWPTVPRDLYLMSGLDGQYVFIAPSHRTIIVRLGQGDVGGFQPEPFVHGVLSGLPQMAVVKPSPPRVGRRTIKVMLVGNSFTYMNNLGAILGGIADGLTRGPAIEASMVVRGAARLAWHAKSPELQASLAGEVWDAVVLQEQSRLLPEIDAMTPEQLADATGLGSPEHFHAAVRVLAPRIRAADAQPILFQTWSRRDMPQHASILASAYNRIGEELGIVVSPVGDAWAAAGRAVPELNLYWFDRSHPGPAGSYLAGLVLYRSITGLDVAGAPARIVGHPTLRDGLEDPSRLSVLVQLPPNIAAELQAIADQMRPLRSEASILRR